MRVRAVLPLLADLVCVLAFAAGGKDSHEADASNAVVLAIVWPYAVAALLAHAVLMARRRSTARVAPEGLVVLAATYVLGMLLRAASGRGIAVGFLVVAAIFLSLTMLGWRGVTRWIVSRSAARRRGSAALYDG